MDEMKFADLNLSPQLMKDLEYNGFKTPMPVQEMAIPMLMEGRDLMTQAKTGTGKTLAFGIPIIERTDVNSHDVQSLILAPTRELAEQVAGEMRKIGYNKKVKTAAVYGGFRHSRLKWFSPFFSLLFSRLPPGFFPVKVPPLIQKVLNTVP